MNDARAQVVIRKKECSKPDYEYYYYERTTIGNYPAITVCLLLIGGFISRGLTLCSPSEPYIDKECARQRARGRAMKAFYRRKTSMPIRQEKALKILYSCCKVGAYFDKSVFEPQLTPFEEKLLGFGNIALIGR